MPNRKRRAKQPETNFQNDKLQTRFYAKTENQQDYIVSISENILTFGVGSSGTGKTSLAICVACDWLVHGKIDKIILTKPFIQNGPGIGHLPGEIDLKIAPHLQHFYEYLDLFLGIEQRRKFEHEGKILIKPLEFLRGVTFRDSFCILDEAQNCIKSQIVLFLSRLGMGSKMVVNGDERQVDLKRNEEALEYVSSRLDGVEGIGVVRFGYQDIMRHGLIRKILERLE